jgi:hypothetical protein
MLLNDAMNRQSGNVFLVVLMGIVLFSAFVLTVTRGLSTGAEKMSHVQSRNVAADLLAYGAQIERAVAKITENGVSENDISFENSIVSGYAHSPVVADNAKIFDTTGGGMVWRKPLASSSTTATDFIFTGDIGFGNENNNSELAMVLPGIPNDLCTQINANASQTLVTAGAALTAVKFTGAFANNATKIMAVQRNAGCAQDFGGELGGKFFYYVLYKR